MRLRRTALLAAALVAVLTLLIGVRALTGFEPAALADAVDRDAAAADARAALAAESGAETPEAVVGAAGTADAGATPPRTGPAPADASWASSKTMPTAPVAAFPAPAPRAGAMLAAAIDAAGAGDRTRADAQAAATGAPVAEEIVLWLRLQDGDGSWAEHRGFLARNPDWPGVTQVRRMAEYAMPAGVAPNVVLGVFQGGAPLTGGGALRLADALAATGRDAAARAEIARAWRELSMAPGDQAAIIERWGDVVAPLHVERLDMLLWRGLTAEASRMLDLAPEDWRLLAKARIAVRRDADGSSAAIAATPATLRRHPGLLFERYLYRVERERWDEAEDYLLEHSTSARALGRPDMWMERRANLARQALRRGDVAAAYDLAARNFGNAASGADYADAEWVAGYVALTRMDDPARAAAHFARFRDAVATPISLGRAGYWLGAALEAAGDAAGAQTAWTAAAAHQTSFYGQLAAERAGVAADPRLAGGTAVPDWRGQAFVRSSVVQAAQLLHRAGEDVLAAQFFRHAAEGLPAAQRAALAQMASDIGKPHLGVRIAKDAAADGVLLPNQYYPLHAMADAAWPVPTEFALAVARQESEFNPGAVSPAGARGLMQLMPATAAEVSGRLGVGYDLGRLTADPMYNARLGTAYLSRMLRAYDGSYVLAAAAYNAGPGRVDQWLETYGDPRGGAIDPIDWIETIPFEETQNYVMRVLESLHVYRARLEGEAQPIRLASDIRGAT